MHSKGIFMYVEQPEYYSCEECGILVRMDYNCPKCEVFRYDEFNEDEFEALEDECEEWQDIYGGDDLDMDNMTNANGYFGISLPELRNKIKERDKEIARLTEALKTIAKYGIGLDRNDGICPYGCDCPHIAQEAIKSR